MAKVQSVKRGVKIDFFLLLQILGRGMMEFLFARPFDKLRERASLG